MLMASAGSVFRRSQWRPRWHGSAFPTFVPHPRRSESLSPVDTGSCSQTWAGGPHRAPLACSLCRTTFQRAVTRRFSASNAPARMRAKRLGVCMILGIVPSDDLRCKSGIQPRANENQYRCGQEDDGIVATQTEGARAAGKHESAQSIDHVGQGI